MVSIQLTWRKLGFNETTLRQLITTKIAPLRLRNQRKKVYDDRSTHFHARAFLPWRRIQMTHTFARDRHPPFVEPCQSDFSPILALFQFQTAS